MTLIREEEIIITEIIEEPFDYAEFFDHTRFPMPAEIYISDEEFGW